MSNVIPFDRTKADKEEASPEPSGLIAYCGNCAGQRFFLHDTGDVECAACGGVSPNIKVVTK